MFKEIAEIFSKIESSKGTNSKKQVIEDTLKSEYKDDFEIVLKHLYDPQIVTGISKTSWNSSFGDLGDRSFHSIKELIEYIQKNNTGKKETVNTLRYVYDNLLENDNSRKLFYWIVTKDVNIGISTTTVRKYIEIPKFEIMLCHRIDENTDYDKEFILTKKYDGINLTCIKRNGKCQFITRQGKIVEGLDNLEREYQKLNDGVFFGEAIYNGKSQDRKELYRLSAGEINSKSTNKNIIHYLFDYVSLDEWDSNNFVIPYGVYFTRLEKSISEINSPILKIVEKVYKGVGQKEAFEKLKEAKEKGWEGLVLRYYGSVYEKTRSENSLKMKPFFDMDLRITGYKEFKHPNMLGAFIVDYKGNDVSVGSGFSKEDREEFWKKRDEMIGKIISVQYMEETQNKEGKLSLRFPVFLRIRNDKSEISYD